MSRLELKVAPDIVWLVMAALMWLAASLTPKLAIPGYVRTVAAILLFAAGITLIVAVRVALDRAHTTWWPSQPQRTTRLVTTGVFGFSRNPTYLGMWLVLVGLSVVLSSPIAFVLTLGFLLYIDRFQVQPEERVLAKLIGEEYRDYTGRVRRWI